MMIRFIKKGIPLRKLVSCYRANGTGFLRTFMFMHTFPLITLLSHIARRLLIKPYLIYIEICLNESGSVTLDMKHPHNRPSQSTVWVIV